jgi:cytidine deaminase
VTHVTIYRQELLAAACAVRPQAYAPYSHFQVGAAVQTGDGRIITGCNVENASYGLTVCAERGAVLAAVAAGQRKLVAIAVASQGGVTPCGACRQVLAEFADDLVVLLVDVDHPECAREVQLSALLPERFAR